MSAFVEFMNFITALGVALLIVYIILKVERELRKNRKKKNPLKFPVRIRTDDGYILIEPRYECCDIEIKRVHEKGKTYYPNVQMRMGLSDVHFIHGTGKNKKTWTEVIHVPTGLPPFTFLKFVTVLQRMLSDGQARDLEYFKKTIGIDEEGIL